MFDGIDSARLDYKIPSDELIESIQHFAKSISGVDVFLIIEEGIHLHIVFDTPFDDDIKIGVIISRGGYQTKVFYYIECERLDLFTIHFSDMGQRFSRNTIRLKSQKTIYLKNFMFADNFTLYLPKLFQMIDYLLSIDPSIGHIVGGINDAISVFVHLERNNLDVKITRRGTPIDFGDQIIPVTIIGRETSRIVTLPMFVDVELEII